MRTLLIAIVLVTSRLAGEEPKKPGPPDRKAYSEALRVSDPGKKIEALRKFVGEYPKSASVNNGNDLILQTLAKSFPHRSREVRDGHAVVLDRPHLRAGRLRRGICAGGRPARGGSAQTLKPSHHIISSWRVEISGHHDVGSSRPDDRSPCRPPACERT